MYMKTCSKCKIEKELGEFRLCKYPNGREYYYSVCKECVRIAARQYAAEHREERRLDSKERYKNNPEYKKQWKEENRDRLNQEYRERLEDDIEFKLRKNCSRSINRALNKQGLSKAGNSVLDYLPYTLAELKQHLESQFEPWMNWENWGIYDPKKWDDNNVATWVWNIDHIIPHSEFPYISMENEAFKECWALTNLRPYSAKQNIIDGSTRIRHNINNDVLL